jgi:hypothetical protein
MLRSALTPIFAFKSEISSSGMEHMKMAGREPSGLKTDQ